MRHTKIAVIFASIWLCICAVVAYAGDGVSFCAVGDVLLDRGVGKLIDKYGYGYPFEKVSSFLGARDIALCNLECPVSDTGVPLTKKYVFRADPAVMAGLKSSGLNIFGLANNHTIDFGRDALMDTIRLLEGAGLKTVGAGRNQAEAGRCVVIENNGVKVALVAYVIMPLEAVTYLEDRPGPAQPDIDGIVEAVMDARRESDIVIVSLHWGTEFSPYPSDYQTLYAHRLIDSGADLVIGHHPHVIQSIESYKGKIILYSLGNFVFDQRRIDGRQAMIFGCTFKDGRVTDPFVVPVVIYNAQPDFATGEDYYTLCERIRHVSEGYNLNFEEASGMLLLRPD